MDHVNQVSNAFQIFIKEGGQQQQAWLEAVMKLGAASALEPKTGELSYIAVLAAARLESGIPFHVREAKALGASRQEIISAVLVGLPAVGHAVIQVLPAALAAYDAEE